MTQEDPIAVRVIAEQHAEIERLKAALRDISKECIIDTMHEIARNALAEPHPFRKGKR